MTTYRDLIPIEKCARCGYCEIKCSLHVHHIDGDRTNNNPSNLAILCANCHYGLHHNQWSLRDIGIDVDTVQIFGKNHKSVAVNKQILRLEEHNKNQRNDNLELLDKIHNLEREIRTCDFKAKAELLYYNKEKVILSFIATYTESFAFRDMLLYLLYSLTDEQLIQVDTDLCSSTRELINEVMSTFELGMGRLLLSCSKQVELHNRSLCFVCDNGLSAQTEKTIWRATMSISGSD